LKVIEGPGCIEKIVGEDTQVRSQQLEVTVTPMEDFDIPGIRKKLRQTRFFDLFLTKN
jgi:hypothetical protein